MVACECNDVHKRKRIVLTGGPGAGKTALLELIRQSFCAHVKVLPEAASIIFGGGFPGRTMIRAGAPRNAPSSTFSVSWNRLATATIPRSCCAIAEQSTAWRTGQGRPTNSGHLSELPLKRNSAGTMR